MREPHRKRPFRVPWYPVPVVLVIAIAAIIVVSSLVTEPLYTSLAFGIIFLAFPMHWLLERYGCIGRSTIRTESSRVLVENLSSDGDGGEYNGDRGDEENEEMFDVSLKVRGRNGFMPLSTTIL
jgi:hypothetical protein